MRRTNDVHRALLVLSLAGLWTSPARLDAAECSRLRPDARPAFADAIGLYPEPGVPVEAVQWAVDAWGACSSYGGGPPELRIGRRGTRDLYIRLDPAAIGSDERCGAFSGRTITLFARTRTEAGSIVRCGSLAQNLVHELGHALGLDDAPRSCDSFAMARLSPRNVFHRQVQPPECRLLGRRWLPLGATLRVERPAPPAATYPWASSSGSASRGTSRQP